MMLLRYSLVYLCIILFGSLLCRATPPSISFADANRQVSQLPQTELVVNGHRLRVEVAATYEASAKGLMFRTSLAPDAGMLFIFPVEHQASFWMKNTALPLSIAYLDKAGIILEIHDLIPYELKPVVSKSKLVIYALEVNRDWFLSKGVKPGMKINDLPKLVLNKNP